MQCGISLRINSEIRILTVQLGIWQYVIQDPKVGHNYGYRARVVVKPFKGTEQIWIEYRKWKEDLTLELPEQPIENVH